MAGNQRIKIPGLQKLLQACRSNAQKAQSSQQQLDQLKKQFARPPVPTQIQQQIQELGKQAVAYSKGVLGAMDDLIQQQYGEEGQQLTGEARAKWLSELSFVKAGLVEGRKFRDTYENQLAMMVVKNLLPRRSQRYGTEIHEYTDIRGTKKDTGKYTRPLRRSQQEYPPVPSYLEKGKKRSGRPKTSDLMSTLSGATRPYHQAMEIDINDPAHFCADMLTVNDPRVMIALRVRMDNENASPLLIESWQDRMREIMLDQCAQRTVMAMNQEVLRNVKSKVGSDRHPLGEPKDAARKLTEEEQSIVQATQDTVNKTTQRYLTHFYSGRADQWVVDTGFDTRMSDIWLNGLKKPDGWSDDVKGMTRKYMPTGKALADHLVANNMVPSNLMPFQ